MTETPTATPTAAPPALFPTPGVPLAAGLLFLLTFVSAIAGVALYAPLLDDPRWVLGAGPDTGVLLGALCELVLILANLGTALVLQRALRPHDEALSLAYVVARVLECTFIAVGILCVLAVVTLRGQAGAADSGAYLVTAQALVAVRDWTFLLGPGFVVGIGNGLILGLLLWRSRLVPRGMALVGVVGGPLLTLSGVAVLFGLYGQGSPVSAVATLPEVVWEAFLGVYLTIVGVVLWRRRRAAG